MLRACFLLLFIFYASLNAINQTQVNENIHDPIEQYTKLCTDVAVAQPYENVSNSALSPEQAQAMTGVYQQLSSGFNEQPLDPYIFEQLLAQAPEPVRMLITVLQSPYLQDDWPHAVLLEGKPGVGKSTYAKLIAQATNRPFIFIRTATLANEYQHSGSSNIERLFREVIAIAQYTPCVLIFDEINAIADHAESFNGTKRAIDRGTSEALWMWLDAAAKNKNILVVGTTNDATTMMPQLISRFEGEVITIDAPDTNRYRCEILYFYLSMRAHACSMAFLQWFAGKTKGLTPRSLEKLISKARHFAAQRSSDAIIEPQDLKSALITLHKGRKRTQVSWLKQYAQNFYTYGVPIIGTLSSVCMIAGFIYTLCKGDSMTRKYR